MKKYLVIPIIASVLLTGCFSEIAADKGVAEQPQQQETVEEKEIEEVEEKPEEKPVEEEKEVVEINLHEVQPNEAGEVMVLMYHQIREPEAEWSRTPENFRKDLQALYDEGFRPISLYDYATGNITTEAGYTPVVFTFDDGNQNNFNMIQDADGEWGIDPDSAVGMLVDFNEKHPDFPLEATFFINGGTPFGQKEFVEYKLKYLVEKGMDVGNHTNTHINFTSASKEKIQEELGKLQQLINQYLPDYEVNTLALPFGSKPKDTELFKYVESGEYEGKKYNHLAILEVGWDPYHSSFSKNFNPSKIRRVRASETKVDGVGMYDWIKAFKNGNRTRYISDGDPNTITVQEKHKDVLSEDLKGKALRTYTLE